MSYKFLKHTVRQSNNFGDLIHMPIKTLGLILIFLSFTATVSWSEEVDGCPGVNQLEVNQCASFSFYEADAELNKSYEEQMSRIETPKIKKRLRDSQRAWIVFRDKACRYETGPSEESGSIWPLHHFGCMERQTRKRIEDLTNYLDCTTDDCPR
jgi:uncharacterized protein YecT (DUF1311 family)